MYILSREEKKGRRLAIITIGIFLGFSFYDLLTYSMHIKYTGSEKILSLSLDLAISSAFSYRFYIGSSWAKLLMGIIMLLSSFTYMLRILEAVISTQFFTTFTLVLAIGFIINCITGIIILSSGSIKSFMDFQKRR